MSKIGSLDPATLRSLLQNLKNRFTREPKNGGHRSLFLGIGLSH